MKLTFNAPRYWLFDGILCKSGPFVWTIDDPSCFVFMLKVLE